MPLSTRVSTISRVCFAAAVICLGFSGCATRTGKIEKRTGDEIVVAGNFVHTGTRVVTWMEPGGYDAYRVERRFAPFKESDWDTSHEKVKDLRSPSRYSLRKSGLTDEQIEKVRGGGWDLPMLQSVVDQFVLHFDVAGISKTCFKVLHDSRDLSVHFMLDVDGTIYQTLDLKERAWHATSSNNRSIGIEIANMGGYSKEEKSPLHDWYKSDGGKTILTIPARYGTNVLYTKNFVGQPARPEPVRGEVQGHMLSQYDYTPEQYEALAKLTATLCSVFPKIKCDYPRDASGKLITRKLSDDDLGKYQGVLGHYHIQTNKTDPGPALQWDYIIGKAQRLLRQPTEHGATAQLKTRSIELDRSSESK
ncbi:MAG: negative regulator of beta-lactamase expression [Verrucomicrobiales bacterium]|nr:negative regulator of beta-lactamase expression [Verrucomicrobiales bacterium]